MVSVLLGVASSVLILFSDKFDVFDPLSSSTVGYLAAAHFGVGMVKFIMSISLFVPEIGHLRTGPFCLIVAVSFVLTNVAWMGAKHRALNLTKNDDPAMVTAMLLVGVFFVLAHFFMFKSFHTQQEKDVDYTILIGFFFVPVLIVGLTAYEEVVSC